MSNGLLKIGHRELIPCVTDTDNMIHVAQDELEDLVRQDAGRIRKAEQGVIGEDGPQTHGPRMQNSLMTEITETCVTVHDLDPLSNDDITKDGQK